MGLPPPWQAAFVSQPASSGRQSEKRGAAQGLPAFSRGDRGEWFPPV